MTSANSFSSQLKLSEQFPFEIFDVEKDLIIIDTTVDQHFPDIGKKFRYVYRVQAGESLKNLSTFAAHVENVLELQMLSTKNEKVQEMIVRYNVSSSNIIDNLIHDQENIMFRIGVAASKFRRMNCTMSIDSLGEEGNVAFITLPMSLPDEQATKQKQAAHSR